MCCTVPEMLRNTHSPHLTSPRWQRRLRRGKARREEREQSESFTSRGRWALPYGMYGMYVHTYSSTFDNAACKVMSNKGGIGEEKRVGDKQGGARTRVPSVHHGPRIARRWIPFSSPAAVDRYLFSHTALRIRCNTRHSFKEAKKSLYQVSQNVFESRRADLTSQQGDHGSCHPAEWEASRVDVAISSSLNSKIRNQRRFATSPSSSASSSASIRGN